MVKFKILPSLLSADVMRLGEEIQTVIQAGADMIHLDVMDNHYVPNLTFGPLICEGIRKRFRDVVIDVHIMATPTDTLTSQFIKAGANRISIHPDATIHLDRSLQLIQEMRCKAGLALNPSTDPACIQYVRHRLDYVLLMTVNPGFSGQALIPEMLEKIAKIHHQYPDLAICVDGGVCPENIREIARAGATEFVAGSAIFNHSDYASIITTMRNQLLHEKN